MRLIPLDRLLFISFCCAPVVVIALKSNNKSKEIINNNCRCTGGSELNYLFALTKLQRNVTISVNKGVDLLNAPDLAPTLRKLVKTANTCESINCKLDYPSRPFDFPVMARMEHIPTHGMSRSRLV